jgi:hypothetical protein
VCGCVGVCVCVCVCVCACETVCWFVVVVGRVADYRSTDNKRESEFEGEGESEFERVRERRRQSSKVGSFASVCERAHIFGASLLRLQAVIKHESLPRSELSAFRATTMTHEPPKTQHNTGHRLSESPPLSRCKIPSAVRLLSSEDSECSVILLLRKLSTRTSNTPQHKQAACFV